MKKSFLVLILSIFIILGFTNISQASDITNNKTTITKKLDISKNKKYIKKVINKQAEFAKKYDLDGLKTLYSTNFTNSDGFNRDIYFKLIQKTWATYPDIVYTMQIKNISFNDDKATVEVYETSAATVSEKNGDVEIFGQLTGFSNSTYVLQKTGRDWLIISETVKNEKSFLKYGDARFIEMDLSAPQNVIPHEYYTSTLTIKDAPKDTLFVASINQDNITYPQGKTNDIFRKVPEDNILERMFFANQENKNEYNVASVGMTKSFITPEETVKFYMTGIAFIMTRVNVGENNNAK